MSTPPTLETDRLLLRPLTLDDAPQTQRLFPHWEIVRFLNASVPWPYPADGALSYYRDIALPAIEQGREWHWTLRLKHSPESHIGTICLCRNADDNRGFWLGTPWQGQRLMLEAVSAVTDYGFAVLGFSVLRTKKAVANAASRRISQQTDMRLVGTQLHDFVAGRLPAEVWEITRQEWAARKSSHADSTL
jgi:ribosomal-protein-alanine N-acetyltransferase